MRHRLLLVALVALTAAACSSSESETLIDLDGPSATVPTTTTTSSTTTTSTSTTTSTTTTTLAVEPDADEATPPPLTASEPGTIAADVETAFWRMEQTRLAAFAMAPFDAEASGISATMVGDYLERFTTTVQGWSDNNEVVRLDGDEIENAYVLEISPSEDGATALVRVCYLDDLTVYDSVTGEILDDSVATTERLYVFASTPEGWRASFAQTESSEEGVTGCLLDV